LIEEHGIPITKSREMPPAYAISV